MTQKKGPGGRTSWSRKLARSSIKSQRRNFRRSLSPSGSAETPSKPRRAVPTIAEQVLPVVRNRAEARRFARDSLPRRLGGVKRATGEEIRRARRKVASAVREADRTRLKVASEIVDTETGRTKGSDSESERRLWKRKFWKRGLRLWSPTRDGRRR